MVSEWNKCDNKIKRINGMKVHNFRMMGIKGRKQGKRKDEVMID